MIDVAEKFEFGASSIWIVKDVYGVSLRTKINLKKRSDLPGEINSDIKNMCSNKQNATLKQKIMVQDNKKM